MIIFPEMSLTGYERKFARSQSPQQDARLLLELQNLAGNKNIVIVAGAPIEIEFKLYIGSFIFFTNGSKKIYLKQFLHPGEEEYFSSRMDYDPQYWYQNEKAAFAICYDIENDKHVIAAAKRNSNLYIASIFYSMSGDCGHKRLREIAEKYKMNVIMANFVGHCWDKKAGGRSAVWSKSGELAASCNDESECILIAEMHNDQWLQLLP